MFDDFWSDMLVPFTLKNESSGFKTSSHMKVDIFEKDDAVFIEAELPGVSKEDIKIDVKGKLISLGAERKSARENDGSSSYRRERVYGKFERTFSLPFDIDSAEVKAVYKDGILELVIPKPKEQEKKIITIN